MSRDQRPGRIKMVGATPEAQDLGRRVTDAAVADTAPGTDATVTAVPAGRSGVLMMSALFLVACAAGGAAVALLLSMAS